MKHDKKVFKCAFGGCHCVDICSDTSVFAVGYAAYVVPHNNADGRYL